MCNGRTGGQNCDFGDPPGGVPSSCGYNPGNNFLIQQPDIESLSTAYNTLAIRFLLSHSFCASFVSSCRI